MTVREVTMPDTDLARRVRDYARGPGRAAVVVSSAWLARQFEVDPRTIAAALRPFGVRPGEVEPGVRGYSVADLAGLELEPDVLAGRIPTEASALPDGWESVPVGDDADPFDGVEAVPAAVAVLSAAAGHDMTPALRAAGLL